MKSKNPFPQPCSSPLTPPATRCNAEGRIKDQTTVGSFQKLIKIAKTAYKIIKEVTGKTLIQKGLKPGPNFGKQLNSLRAQKFALLLSGK